MIINYENKYEHIEHLENTGLITHGCALCMIEYGVCEHAVTKLASPNESFIDCEPFGDIGIHSFPASCLTEWYGKEYVENINKEEN